MDSESVRHFTLYVRRRQAHLLRAATLLCGDPHTAEDLLQEALVKVAKRWPAIRTGNPDAYLRRILYRDTISLWRRRRDFVVAELPEPAAQPDHADDHARKSDVRSALQTLAPRQRAVLVLRFYEQLSVAETATLLEISEGTVKSQTSDGLHRMRALLGPEWGRPPRQDGATRDAGRTGAER